VTDSNVPTDRRPWILAALMLSMMLAAMDTTIVSTAVPQVVADLGGFALFTWVFSIYLLAQTVTIPIYGKLADIYGRKPVLIAGSLLFLAGSAASAAAWNMPSLIAFRAVQGLGAGSIMATVNTLAGDMYNLRERARIQGFLASVWGMAAVIGPTLGGAFAEYLSWRWIFLVNLPIGAGAIVLLLLFLHESVDREPHQIDFAGSAAVLAAVGALIFGLLQGGTAWPWLSTPSLIVFGCGALLVVLAVWVERRAAEPIMPGWLWRHRSLAGANLAMVGMGFVVMGPSAYLPTFAQSVFGLGAVAAGLVLASMSIGWPTASALSGRLYLRIGFRDTALIGSVLICVAAAAFLALPYRVPLWMVVVDQVTLGAGFGLLSTSLLVGAQTSTDWRSRGVVTGANMFSRFLGQSLGVAVFGAIFNAGLIGRLTNAPANLTDRLPHDVNNIMTALKRPGLSDHAASYLRHAIYGATHHLYVGLLIVAVVTLGAVLTIPRGFEAKAHSRRAADEHRP
jgi:EmrB/QacA subfamily drug resistance transporter